MRIVIAGISDNSESVAYVRKLRTSVTNRIDDINMYLAKVDALIDAVANANVDSADADLADIEATLKDAYKACAFVRNPLEQLLREQKKL